MSAIVKAIGAVADVLSARAAIIAAQKAAGTALADAYAEAAREGFPDAEVAAEGYADHDEDGDGFFVRVSFAHPALGRRPLTTTYDGAFEGFDIAKALTQVRKDAMRRAEVLAVLRECGIDVFRDTPDPGRLRRPSPGIGNGLADIVIYRGMAFRLPLNLGAGEVRRAIQRLMEGS